MDDRNIVRMLTMADAETCAALICDQRCEVERGRARPLSEAGIWVAQTRYQAP